MNEIHDTNTLNAISKRRKERNENKQAYCFTFKFDEGWHNRAGQITSSLIR